MTISQTLFSFSGRIGRLAYLGYTLLMALFVGVTIGGGIALMATGETTGAVLGGGLAAIGFLLSIWMGLALLFKRLHDIGMSGAHSIWIYLINLAPNATALVSPTVTILLYIVSFGVMLWLLFMPGDAEPNKYGPPRGAAAQVPATA